METLKEVLMRRDGNTEAEALERMQDAADAIDDGDDPEEVLAQDFGLEPDYIFELLELCNGTC